MTLLVITKISTAKKSLRTHYEHDSLKKKKSNYKLIGNVIENYEQLYS